MVVTGGVNSCGGIVSSGSITLSTDSGGSPSEIDESVGPENSFAPLGKSCQ